MTHPPTIETKPERAAPSVGVERLVAYHVTLGWGALLVFIAFGAGLEAFHAFKSPFYLDAENETRRLMWRLAHAHGALLSLLQIAGAFSLSWLQAARRPCRSRLISRCLVLALILLPGGFFLAGFTSVDGDPGFGIVLVPTGAVFLTAAAALIFHASRAKT